LKTSKVSLSDTRALAEFRYELRCFLAFSEDVARAAGIEPQQHQLLLAIGGLPARRRPNIRTLAERLCVQHHTAVALVDKLVERGFVRRERSTEDKRQVLVRLTDTGADLLQELSRQHRRHLQRRFPRDGAGSVAHRCNDPVHRARRRVERRQWLQLERDRSGDAQRLAHRVRR
jgi:DNA-binding MarR family transcriptional regulator